MYFTGGGRRGRRRKRRITRDTEKEPIVELLSCLHRSIETQTNKQNHNKEQESQSGAHFR